MILKIRNWDRWQSYRKDRGQPPWIKIHRGLMRDPSWVALTDAQRGQLVAIWMLAADRGGVIGQLGGGLGEGFRGGFVSSSSENHIELISNSAETIRRLCFMKHKPNLQFFIDQGFIEKVDAIVTPDGRQDDHLEENREEKSRGDSGVSVDVSQQTSQSSPVESPNGHPTKYVFESGVIRLKEKDFESWKRVYQNIDVPAELTGMADWAAKQPNWFTACSGLLNKRNREQKTKIDMQKQGGGVKWRSGTEGVV